MSKLQILERKRIEKEQARLVAIIEATPDMVASGDSDGRATYCNPAGLRMLGFERLQELSAQHYLNVHPAWAEKLVRETGIPHAVAHGSWSGETALLRGGREIPVSQVILAHKGEDGQIEYLSTVVRDISALKESERRIMRLNRVYAVLSSINTTIVRTRSRQELFDETCRIAVEQGQFRFAWVGLFDAEGAHLTPVARAGFENGYLDRIVLSTRDDTAGCFRMLVQALRESKLVVCNDIENDPRMKCWREEAARRGYLSMAVFPLRCGTQVVGLLSLYAAERDFFDTVEMKLLVEIDDDISFGLDHIEKEERLNYLAYYDDLTGLPNRALFYDRLNQILPVAERQKTLVALLLVNLERMRDINETLGRAGGDTLLKMAARRLGESGMNVNHLAHFGAGYFAVALDNIQREADAAHTLEHDIASCLAKPFAVGGKELRVSAKAGIALFPSDGADADTLFRNADAALKKAKLAGDKYLFYTPELNARVAENLMLENKLRRALEREQLVLHYQPKIDLRTGNISGLEALMRWNDPDSGLVPPMQFIPLLEESGLILDAGQWALEQAAADFRRWRANGLPTPRIAVNVSAFQLRHKDFVGMVGRVLGDAGDMAASLGIEITESMIMHDIEASIRKLQVIRDMGLEIAVDDFGTGYSSLSYIARLPVNTLKIDRSFIAHITSRATDISITSAIVSLGRSLGLKVIAEGVETEGQKTLLQQLGCDEMQGYLFSKPLPSAEMETMLRRGINERP
ncbi:MAG: EAL domain-containing protein [Nitrosomonadales bacterium]|nr:EAL domain-containing protein [Nitrosomonadales bacterium]